MFVSTFGALDSAAAFVAFAALGRLAGGGWSGREVCDGGASGPACAVCGDGVAAATVAGACGITLASPTISNNTSNACILLDRQPNTGFPPLNHRSPTTVIAVERLPFTKLTPTSVRLFGLVLDWGAAALQNATRYAATRAASALDDETGAYRGEHMLRLVRQESLRSGRYQFPLSIVMMQIDGYETIAAPVRAELTRTVLGIAGSGLRTVDTIGHHPTPGMFILILPMTATDSVQVAVARIDDKL